jgi:hypothetical protein
MWSTILSHEAANDTEFNENIKDLPSDEIFRIFLEKNNKKKFLQDASLGMKKYIRVFLHWYNYIVDFEEKYWDIFFSAVNSPLQKGVVWVFLIGRWYYRHEFDTFIGSLTTAQIDYILGFFQDYIDPIELDKQGIAPTIQQLQTRKDYWRIWIKSVK